MAELAAAFPIQPIERGPVPRLAKPAGDNIDIIQAAGRPRGLNRSGWSVVYKGAGGIVSP
jgi:hypothetical protein